MTSIQVFTLIAGLLGGLALFLYGMNVMSNGLTKVGGGKLESLMASLTKNRWVAYLFGIGVTALVQSSSASTVMVVGLVNSGIMKLAQAVNVILGANLGTTFTAWLLSLNAISSDNFFINLFKPMSFTPFLAIIGVALLMFSKTDKKKELGTVLVGFAFLIFGMDMMSSAVAPLKSSADFQSVLTTFDNPLIGFLVGILFTMVIQSSAGTIGVVQALSLSIFISNGMAMPIVVGAEVGTCITAILSSFGANKNGKRTALMHLYFNVLKAGLFMIIFYSLNAVFHFEFLNAQATMVSIASVHTLLNLVATPLMVPFSGILVKLAVKTIPPDKKELEEQKEQASLAALDARFLSNPSFALRQAKIAANDMANLARDSFEKAVTLIGKYDTGVAEEVAYLERKIDHYEDSLGTYLVKMGGIDLSIADSHRLSIILHCITDFERISDHSYNIMLLMKEMNEKNMAFSAKALEELRVFSDAVRESVSISASVFAREDVNLALKSEPLEEVIEGIHMEVKRRHVRRLRKGKCTIELGFVLSDLGTDFERIAAHCSNISVCVLQVNQDGYDTHEYLEMVREERNEAFSRSIEEFEQKYSLPVKKTAEEEEEAAKAQAAKAQAEKEEKAKKEEKVKPEKPEKQGKPEKSEKPVKTEKPVKPEKPAKPEKTEKPSKEKSDLKRRKDTKDSKDNKDNKENKDSKTHKRR